MSFLDFIGLTRYHEKLKEIFALKSSLSKVATSGSYDDLSNKPTITELGGVSKVNGVSPDDLGNVTIDVGSGSGGGVQTVNNISPDEKGNVSIDIPDTSAFVNDRDFDPYGVEIRPDPYPPNNKPCMITLNTRYGQLMMTGVSSVEMQTAGAVSYLTTNSYKLMFQGGTKGGLYIENNVISVEDSLLGKKDSLSNHLNKRVAKTGDRGELAGYETSGTATTINQNSSDSNETSEAVTVQDGTKGTSWVKIVRLTSPTPTVTLGAGWTWCGGAIPTLKQNGMLICAWCGNGGIVDFASTN